MRAPMKAVAVALALQVSLPACAPVNPRVETLSPPYTIDVDCEAALQEVGNVVRITTTESELLVGNLSSVRCEEQGIVILGMRHASAPDSSAVVSLGSIVSIEVLEEQSTEGGRGQVGVLLASMFLSLVVVVVVLTNIEVGE